MLGATKPLRMALMGMATLALVFGASTNANARHHHHHGGWGWAGPAFVGGLALGALATPYYYGPPCHTERRVYFTRSGHRIVRYVRVCY